MLIFCMIVIVILIYLMYMLYFKEYVDLKKTFDTLEKVLDERDILVLKIIPEIKLKKLAGKVSMLIDKRNKERKSGYTIKMYIDIELNKELKNLYEEINKLTSNSLIANMFKKIISLERILKDVREEYNNKVEKYNKNLINHKFVCMRILKMKPLDTYTNKSLSK